MIVVKKYSESHNKEWDYFLFESRTPVFLFSRNYMDYHRDRFEDFSICIYDDNKLAALFPACKIGDILYSHAGLTFGGIILSKNVYGKKALLYMQELFKFCLTQNLSKIFWKQPPSFYSNYSQEDTEHGLFLVKAILYRMDTSFCKKKELAIPYQERRIRALKKAEKHQVIIEETADFSSFWEKILEPNLLSRFGVKPVHTVHEITSLALANHRNIRQFIARKDDRLLAGCTIFENSIVAHAQYISATDEGRQIGAIDLLFHQLISVYFSDKPFFDFGIANENGGYKYNTGLMDWKESFGARAYAHRFYEINPSNYILIDQALS